MQPGGTSEPWHEDPVDEAGLESFPASDPPSFTLGHDRRPEPEVSYEEQAIVAGVFENETTAADAVYRLTEFGFDAARDIEILAVHHRQKSEVTERFRTGGRAGLWIGILAGGAVGAILGVLMANGTLPDLAHIGGALGPSVVFGAMLGALTGYLIGVLGGIAVFWSQETAFDRTKVHGGAVRVAVRATTAERARIARDVLRSSGARHFQEG